MASQLLVAVFVKHIFALDTTQMKKLFLIVLSIIPFLSIQAQHNKCGFDRQLEHLLSEDPSLIQDILELQDRAEEITDQRLTGNVERGGGPRIIPTVFHVIHQGGNENISYEQIEDQIRILNEDYRRLNADAANTRAEFLAVAADASVEFRLAKLDPQGNCTDGVVRLESPLTFNASDESGVKGLSYWPSNRYLNVWVVATIDNEGQAGTVLGYAQFPGFGSAQTDGVVVRANYVGDIGTASGNGNAGRVLTHEAGHWLGLFHTFQGGCNGGFPFGEGVDDTPPTAEANFGCPLSRNSCSNDNPDLLDMVENYMDYSNGSCQNIFTLGQKDKMDAVLDGSRSQIHSESNLSFTGVDNLNEVPCQPYAHFYADETIVCAGNDIEFTDDSYNGEVTTYDWQFPNATPNSSSNPNPTVSYSTPGLYSVTLNVSNAIGNDSYTRTDYVRVLPSTAQTTSWIGFEGFEETVEDYLIFSDNVGNTWEESSASFTGNTGIMINNYSGNPMDSEDEFMLPSVDLTQMNDPKIYFRLSYKQRTGQNDNLRVYVSRNCGETWSMRYNSSGSNLATVTGTTGSSFTPSSSSDWELIEVNLNQFANDDHVMVKFRNKSDEGNNIYIDDIQISGPLGIADNSSGLDFVISPNPTADQAQASLHLLNSGPCNISLLGVTGKLISSMHQGDLFAGDHTFNIGSELITNAGVYLIQVEHKDGRSVRKLVVH